MIKAGIIQFISTLNTIPREKIISLLRDTYGEDKSEHCLQHMIDDYLSDCIGFFRRNDQVLINLVDEYNTAITDEYFITRSGIPPLIKPSEVSLIICVLARTSPIDILYEIKKPGEKHFWFVDWHIPVQDFTNFGLQNILFNVLMQIYNDTSFTCWDEMFGEE